MKLRKSTKESWLMRVLMDRKARPLPYVGGVDLMPMGRTLLRKWADEHCGMYGKLTPEHAVRLHDRLVVMAKDIDGAVVECGMVRGPAWRPGYMWAYGAIAVLDEYGRATSGSVLIPGASAVPYYVRRSLTSPRQYHRSLRLWDDLCPVIEDIASPETVTLNRNQVARKDDVRPGDCYLYDLTRAHSPRVVVENLYFGRACRFGLLDEMIDTARCRIVFGSLASA
jgi:hypothetical protein